MHSLLRARSLLAVSLALGAFAPAARAAEGLKGKDLGISAVAGFPELAGLQLSYTGNPWFSVGAGFGSIPVNRFLNSQVQLSSVPLSSSNGSEYTMEPTANYSMAGYSAFARLYPFKGGFFAQVSYAALRATGSMTADLVQSPGGDRLSSVITGSVGFTQPIVNGSIGYEIAHSSGFFLNIGIGGGYLLNPSHSVSVGGTAASILPFIEGAEEDFEESQQELESQIDDGVDKLRDITRFVPGVFIGIGWAFDLG